jgi:hypothetical protein
MSIGLVTPPLRADSGDVQPERGRGASKSLNRDHPTDRSGVRVYRAKSSTLALGARVFTAWASDTQEFCGILCEAENVSFATALTYAVCVAWSEGNPDGYVRF